MIKNYTLALSGIVPLTPEVSKNGKNMKCLYPQRKRKTVNGSTFMFEHPCGTCKACRINTRAAWKLRLLLEYMDWSTASFVTLTYNPDNIPTELDSDGNKIEILNHEHIKKFFKRLRKQLGRKIRYFACGEYGDKGNRPHYHAIIYGHNPYDTESITKAWSKYNRSTKQYEPIGRIDCGEFSTARAGYVVKYALKRLGESVTDLGERPNEYAEMSRRPGIGLQNIDRLVQAIIKTASQCNTTPIQLFRNEFQSINIGGRRLPIHPTLRRRIGKKLISSEVRSKGIAQFIREERKAELKGAIQKDQDIVLTHPLTRKLDEIDAKLLAERKLRQSNRAKKL